MKDEFKDEVVLRNQLNAYTVEIPKEKFAMKQTRWQRFIRYLGSPAQNPLETVHKTFFGLQAMRIVPLVSIVFMTILQMLWIS